MPIAIGGVLASLQIRGVLAAMLVALLVPASHAEDSVTRTAREALAICRGVGTLPVDERVARLDEGLAMAERSKLDDPTNALAYYASFCNRGKRLQILGFSFGAIGEIRRLRNEIDRALELEPDWPDALAGKGALLVALPRLFGGDVVEGERLLRRALELDPDNAEARNILAELERDASVAGLRIARVGFLE
jgi:tetratricopeptide (TPR) repeat protein